MATEGPLAGRSVTFVGCGAMGSAIARGAVAGGAIDPGALRLVDANAGRASELADELGALAGVGAKTAPEHADVIVFCVKPQVLADVAAAWREAAEGSLAISIAAGVSLETLAGYLPGARIVRVMPNLGVAVRSGASAVCLGETATEADGEAALALFGAIGTAALMTERQLDVAGALSGCGPAYVALFVDALTRPAIEAGLPAAIAREFLLATCKGTAQILEDGTHPRAFMERVMSPGGTTVQAVSALEPYLAEGAQEAVAAALRRTEELAQGTA